MCCFAFKKNHVLCVNVCALNHNYFVYIIYVEQLKLCFVYQTPIYVYVFQKLLNVAPQNENSPNTTGNEIIITDDQKKTTKLL